MYDQYFLYLFSSVICQIFLFLMVICSAPFSISKKTVTSKM